LFQIASSVLQYRLIFVHLVSTVKDRTIAY